MDPASAVGVASAVLAIVNLIAKSVASLSALQSRYVAADLKVSLLIGQLSTVKAALNQMAKLLEGDHGILRDLELIMDLKMSLECIETVVMVLEDKISEVQRDASDTLTIRSKVNFMWDEKTMDDYLNLLNNQIHALGLLLGALQCRTALEQSNLLQSRNSRHVFDRLKDDTSSLLCLRDAESDHTCRTDGTQDLGTVKATFTFDPEVFNSKVYQTATRSSMIHALWLKRLDTINDASSLAPGSLRDTSLNENPDFDADSESDNTIENELLDNESLVTTESDTSYLPDAMRESDAQTTKNTIPVTETLENPFWAVNHLQSTQIPSPPMAVTRRDYTIQTRETLRAIPEVSACNYMSPPITTDSPLSRLSIAPEGLGPLNGKRDLSAYTQLVSSQRSNREHGNRSRKASDTISGGPENIGAKVLLLGISASGKSTLKNSLKIAFEEDDEKWRLSFRSVICMSLVESLKFLTSKTIWHILDRRSPWYQKEIAENYHAIDEWLLARSWGLSERDSLPPAVASAVIALSDNTTIRAACDQFIVGLPSQAEDPFLWESVKYYMSSASRIADSKYIPTSQDIIWVRNSSVGLHESRYFIDGTLCRFFDIGGTRSERQKWPRAFADVNSIIFTLDVSCFDQVLAEDGAANRMTEQLAVWDDLVQSKWAAGRNFIVLFTKVDQIKLENLETSRFNSLFPDFPGKTVSSEDILQYLAMRLDAASNTCTTGDVVFCNGGSIRQSPTDMAEVAVSALNEVGLFKSHIRVGDSAAAVDTSIVRAKTITHVTGGPNSRNMLFPTGSFGDSKDQHPVRDPPAWSRTGGDAAYHRTSADLHGDAREDGIPLLYWSTKEELSRGFHDVLSQIGEEDQEDLESIGIAR